MRGPKPATVELSKREREELEALVRKHSTPQQIAQRGRMILLAAEGKRNAQIARELGACVDTVRSWRMRLSSAGRSSHWRISLSSSASAILLDQGVPLRLPQSNSAN
jgi:FixJ family two-component response regulator